MDWVNAEDEIDVLYARFRDLTNGELLRIRDNQEGDDTEREVAGYILEERS